MTDTSVDSRVARKGASRVAWQVVLAGAVAVLTAAVTTLVVRTGDPATAETFLSRVRNAVVVLSDGSSLEARDGLVVPLGATVRTGPDGAARLSTADRDVYLGAMSTLQVHDGVHQRLERGQVMVDARDGPRLALDTKAGPVAVPAQALVRVETGPLLRVGVFEGSARATAAGRQDAREVPELYQVQVPYGGPPRELTALALTNDTWEQRLAAGLVSADQDLNALARGLLDTDGATVLQAAPVALRQGVASRDRGEQALGVAVAQVGLRQGPEQNLQTVLVGRGQGGSWGVVAAIVQARVSAVSALLDRVLAPGQPPTPPVLAGQSPLFPGIFGPSPTSGPRPTNGPRPTPTPTRTPTTPTPTTPPSTVDELVTVVASLLSTPRPTATLPAPPRQGVVLNLGLVTVRLS